MSIITAIMTLWPQAQPKRPQFGCPAAGPWSARQNSARQGPRTTKPATGGMPTKFNIFIHRFTIHGVSIGIIFLSIFLFARVCPMFFDFLPMFQIARAPQRRWPIRHQPTPKGAQAHCEHQIRSPHAVFYRMYIVCNIYVHLIYAYIIYRHIVQYTHSRYMSYLYIHIYIYIYYIRCTYSPFKSSVQCFICVIPYKEVQTFRFCAGLSVGPGDWG